MRVASAAMAAILVSGITARATDFLMEGVDRARTGWVRDEKVFTPANVGTSKSGTVVRPGGLVRVSRPKRGEIDG